MTFSNYYHISRTDADDWLDPALTVDTRLFVDPFLIFEDTDRHWAGAHEELIEFFNEFLSLIAQGADRGWSSLEWRRAAHLATFPEPHEFGLGLCASGVRGSGAGRTLGRAIVQAAADVVALGRTRVRHLEELALFGDGFGVDRVSDITCNVLKNRFITYTQEVARRHGVPLTPHHVAHARLMHQPLVRWMDGTIDLPANPYDRGGGGVLLTPSRFVRTIPVLDAASFWQWAGANLNQELRNDLNFDLTNRFDRERVAAFIRANPRFVDRFIDDTERNGADAYDLSSDPQFVMRMSAAQEIAPQLGAAPPRDGDDMHRFVSELIHGFRGVVRDRGGWRLLWQGDRFRREAQCQALFAASVSIVCANYDVDVSPETDAGNGKVDFKFSRGARAKTVVELKRASATSLRSNVLYQLPAYMSAESTRSAFMLIVQETDKHCTPDFMAEIEELVRARTDGCKHTYEVVWIDARQRPTGSNRTDAA